MIHRLAQQALMTPRRLVEIKSRTVIAEEIERFTPVHRRLIELIAVAGQPLPTDVALNAATRASAETIDLGYLFTARMLQRHRRGSDDLLDTYHDRIRKHVLDSLPAAVREAHHRTLIEAFEAVRPHESERLAYHCEQGGRLAEASRHALIAAQQASGALAFDRAVSLYRRALDLGVWDPQARYRILVDLAGALANAGRGVESAEAFLAAAGRTTGIDDVRLRIKALDQYLRTGHLTEGR